MTTPATITTSAEAYDAWVAKIYSDLDSNFVSSEWNALTVATGGCFTDIKAAVFTVDLDYYSTLCQTVSGCSFKPDNYVPYAFGFRFAYDATCLKSDKYSRIFIPGGHSAAMHWANAVAHTHRETDVSWSGTGPWAYTDKSNFGNANGPFDGYFDGFNYSKSPGLIFTLLKTTTGLEKGKSISAWQTDDKTVEGELTSFTLGWNTWCLKNCSFY